MIPFLVFAAEIPARTEAEIRHFYDEQNEYEEGFWPPLYCKKCGCPVTKAAWRQYGDFWCVNHCHLQPEEVERHTESWEALG